MKTLSKLKYFMFGYGAFPLIVAFSIYMAGENNINIGAYTAWAVTILLQAIGVAIIDWMNR